MDKPVILGLPQSAIPEQDDKPIMDFKSMTQEEMERQVRLQAIVPIIQSRYYSSRDARRPTENKWIDAYRSYRGEYTPEERARISQAQSRNPGASDIYVKVAKTKTLAAYGQITEILFSDNKFPIGVEPTPDPQGIAENAYIEPDMGMPSAEGQDVYGYSGDGKEIEAGATHRSLLGGLLSKYSKYLTGKKVTEGISPDPKTLPQLHPADEAAKNLEKVILDQLSEGGCETELRNMALECTMLGTGILKGPFSYEETIDNWDTDEETGEYSYQPKFNLVPKSTWVSCWHFYPDPDARNITEVSYVIERHLLNRNKLRDLKNQPFFDKKAIDRLLLRSLTHEREYWEDIIQDANTHTSDERYEVLEYWGYLDKDTLEDLQLDKEDLAKFVDVAQVNAWVCGGEVIRLILNPFHPNRIPYYAVPFEEHPYQIWGIGVPENMRDTTSLMNGHMRMAIDNLRFAGNCIFEVNEAQLVPGQDMTLYPGKMFRKQGGAPGQSVYGITVPNVSQSHIQMFDKARQLADESTGQSSSSYGSTSGQTGVRTAAQTSMLMSASAGATKTVVKNFDHYLLMPLGQAYFNWNMQFKAKELPKIKGDVKIVARGTSMLMQREVQSQRLLSFMQVTANPLAAPFVNMEYLIKAIAKSMDLDPDKAVNDPTTAMMYAELMSKMNGNNSPTGDQAQSSGEPGSAGSPQPSTGGINPSDPTGSGGGNIGVGSVPKPGQAGFAASA